MVVRRSQRRTSQHTTKILQCDTIGCGRIDEMVVQKSFRRLKAPELLKDVLAVSSTSMNRRGGRTSKSQVRTPLESIYTAIDRTSPNSSSSSWHIHDGAGGSSIVLLMRV
jgi:hypothetical protein